MHDENPGALDKLYSILQDADSLGLSRPARMRLIGVIGSLENEELERFRSGYLPGQAAGETLPSQQEREH